MKEKKFFRNCPNCNKIIGHTTEAECLLSKKNNNFCAKCWGKKRGTKPKLFMRKCPSCSTEVWHTAKKARNRAEKIGRLCQKCRSIERESRPYIIKKQKELSEKKKIMFSGSGNPFYGKHHTQESKDKIIKNTDYSFTKTKEFAKKSARHGEKNGMHGKRVYDIWEERHGKEEADKRMTEFRNKLSAASSGKNNPMYGRPSPKGSGNGWSGWYKNWYFRSLRELSYMIRVIERKKYEWESAETKKFSITYKNLDGAERTYRADFFINKDTLVEIKPKKMMDTPINREKKKVAIKS